MRRFLIVVAVLAGGCEQLKSPQRISTLEERVEQLSGEIATLKAGSAAGAKPGDAGAGSADEGAAGSGSAAAGEGSGSSDSAGEAHAAGDGGVVDGGVADGARPDDPAMADVRAIVARSTQTGKPAEPAEPGGMPAWAYDGKAGPPVWGTLDPAWSACLKGKAQSPIDIEPKAGKASPIVFRYQPVAATLVDSGHTLQVNLAPGNTIEIAGRTYRLVQLHFHSPSEHTIAGEHYPLEVHLVHQDTDGNLAVVSVLYDAGTESRPLARLWSKWPRKLAVEDKLGKPFDPSELLPEARTVFRYTGSLTTPPCAEGVLWNVMRRMPTDSRADLEAFARHYPHNARELQPLNDRKIE